MAISMSQQPWSENEWSTAVVDILETTLDVKNSFHCTQLMVWKRGSPHENVILEGRAYCDTK